MTFIKKLKYLLSGISKLWGSDISELVSLKNQIESSRNPRLVSDAIGWLHDCERAVVVGQKNEEEYTYDTNDEGFDYHFRNACKDIIRNDMFDRMGQEAYGDNLEEFEPDLFHAFADMEYQIARADWSEAELEYYKAINEPDPNKYNVDDYFIKWKNVERARENLENIKKTYNIE